MTVATVDRLGNVGYPGGLLSRVLVLSSEFPPGPGGIGTHAYHLARELHRHGWDVTVASPQELAEQPAITEFDQRQPFAVHQLKQFGPPPVRLAYRMATVSSLIRRSSPHVIVASGERMVWLAALLQRIHGIPYLAVGHAMEFNVPARWQRTITRHSFERAAAVVCVSEYTRSHMERAGIAARASAVIPNGADDERFGLVDAQAAAAFRTSRGLGQAPLLITVGSVHERKGQDVVIRALPRVIERFPDVQYVMVGMPYRRDAFMNLARELGVADHVHVLGVVDAAEVVRALNAADLFVMASQHTPNGDFEGFGIAVVEAALCGRAAVVSDNSGVVEAIEPGETGLVATISDPRSTADRIIELLADRPRLAAMGQLARKRALATKTWQQRGVEYHQLLRGLVETARPARTSH
ncbi:MAG TPA: glycosyltransferase family 4 protein [Kofleriaceae bacterium]|nr:glycosyltransferase family 4 protein [Kofleriaceae bacterium]